MFNSSAIHFSGFQVLENRGPQRMATDDFFRARLDQMIDLRHSLAVLAVRMPWPDIESASAPAFANHVIEDLEYIFAPIPATERKFRKPKPALGYHEKAVQRLIDGMRDGVKKIALKVRGKGDKLGSLSRVDPGLLEKYRLITLHRTDI